MLRPLCAARTDGRTDDEISTRGVRPRRGEEGCLGEFLEKAEESGGGEREGESVRRYGGEVLVGGRADDGSVANSATASAAELEVESKPLCGTLLTSLLGACERAAWEGEDCCAFDGVVERSDFSSMPGACSLSG